MDNGSPLACHALLGPRLQARKTWLVTGCAGFIGSHLTEALLAAHQRVVGLDNFATGSPHNIQHAAGGNQVAHSAFEFIEGDIRDLETCRRACRGADYVLHQAALGSVPRSIADPISTHDVNVSGFMHMLVAAREEHVHRFVYASSSSVYGDSPDLPKREAVLGIPRSVYAASKRADELYAQAFTASVPGGVPTTGLRYFNVFGPRQDPLGPYAAVIPLWFAALASGLPVYINGDGSVTRDFCYVQNVVQANLLAATGSDQPKSAIYNIACGTQTSLLTLFGLIRDEVAKFFPLAASATPQHRGVRPGDVADSLADLDAARRYIGYAPAHSVAQGLGVTARYYNERLREALVTVGAHSGAT